MSFNRSEDSRSPADWVVSPVMSESSTLSSDAYLTVSPPPYSPAESTVPSTLVTSVLDEKLRSEDTHRGLLPSEQRRREAEINRFVRDGTASHESLAVSTLPEVVWCDLPEVVPSAAPELAHSTLPQVVQAVGDDGPEAVESQMVLSSLPEVATGQVVTSNNNQQLMTVPATPPATVTPLHMLGDQPESIDCPFCQRQTKTVVKKKPSNATHIQAVLLLMTTVCGAVAPYLGRWSFDIEQHCGECKNRVTYRAKGKEIYVCKQPISVQEVSKYAVVQQEPVKMEA
ncbi:hypothetical protein B0J13DRAFT_644026 [Dactylonectria estremocensis]|uniref:LITAF domain-containing protein n=1 Tax=Dactylonectria estremocensis TaxID=1079267 RepID=A0A9P9JCK2_9HYPO|nr:hypothetical protein B0J13DRAFT_644026 [Dactylonectria estremocensis]